MLNRIFVVATIALLVQAAQAQEKPKTAALAGMVRDAFGRGLKDATISVDKTELKAFTNDSGLFFLKDIPAGKNAFSVLRIGYAAVHFELELSPDSTLVLNIPMKNVQTLPGVAVEGERVSAKLMRAGYYERRNQGLGAFIGHEKIEKLKWSTLPSTFLRDTRGVRVVCRRAGLDACQVFMNPNSCRPTVYVNGAKRTGEFDQVVDASEIFAIETYERQVLVPAEFAPAGCVIAVWTKNFADMPDRKP